jgi:gliding motility-associated protein GldC
MDNKVVNTSNIEIKVGMNKDRMPVSIRWKTSGDSKNTEFKESKVLLTTFFDKENKDTLKIDLWTLDMQVVEMDRVIFQTLNSLADTYFRATNNRELAGAMQQFARFFGEQTEIIPKE